METSGILRLNDPNAAENPAYGTHDPGMMWDPRTRRYYSYSTDSYAPKAGDDAGGHDEGVVAVDRVLVVEGADDHLQDPRAGQRGSGALHL